MPEGHVAKKQRVDRGQDGTEGGFLRGVQVCRIYRLLMTAKADPYHLALLC